MIGEALGLRQNVAGGEAIEALPGRAGFAVYGPYATVEPGRYVAEFLLEALDADGRSRACGRAEVVCDFGRTTLARAHVFSSQIERGQPYRLAFSLDRRVETLEMRVYVNGTAHVRVRDACRLETATEPLVALEPKSKFLREHPQDVANLYSDGFGLFLQEGELVAEHSGVAVNVRSFDDVRFLGEIFLARTYSLIPPKPSVVIDVGMNIGVTSLLLAQEPRFEEIHAFEPFPQTYARALANLALNPRASGKIVSYNFGLSDRDQTLSGFFNPEDSGCSSTHIPGAGEHSAVIGVRDASETLGPIFARAEVAGRSIVMKIDCEGAEFAVFRSLARSGLMSRVTALMVEWHRGFGDRDRDLFAPLLQRGFAIVDRDPPEGNGFFYAVRAA